MQIKMPDEEKTPEQKEEEEKIEGIRSRGMGQGQGAKK